MALEQGKQLGAFEILGLLGAGGMGEVYRARDTKLDREVAIKVLPAGVSQVPERVARFEREAKVLASLTHSNIAAIYDLHEADGVKFLVMELVEGATLADQLARGPIPLEQALELFGQIAQALDYAHGRGVIHRDLKPANIKVDPDGQIKILDFGLAKAFEVGPDSGASEAPTLPIPSERDPSTKEGMILGTPAYMSPEQAQGKEVDKRTDIWAFGCCLYEALTGRRTFDGDNSTLLLAEILRGEPQWEALPEDTPGRIRDLLWRCLQKDPRRRLRDIGDAWFEISDASSAPSGAFEALPTTAPQRRSKVEFVGWILALLLGAWIGLSTIRPTSEEDTSTGQVGASEARIRRYALSLPDHLPLARPLIITDTLIDMSRDGSRLVYVADLGGLRHLVLKERDSFEFRLLEGTQGGSSPFFSPDGEWIAFFAASERKLKKLSVRVGTVTEICAATLPLGAHWRDDGTIIFASELSGGLRQVSDQGGQPKVITELDPSHGDVYHVVPKALPVDDHILFLSATGATINDSRPEILNLKTGERKQIAEQAGRTVYLNSGHLLYIREGMVVVRPFDVSSLEFTAPPVPILEARMATKGSIPSQYGISRDGRFAYVPVGQNSALSAEIVKIDREGNEYPTAAPAGPYTTLRLSPDGKAAVLSISDFLDVWLVDLEDEGTPRRFTFDPAQDNFGEWSPDGQEIFFGSIRTGLWTLYRRRLDGRGGTRPLSTDLELINQNGFLGPVDIDPTGRRLLFGAGFGTDNGANIGLVDLEDIQNSRMLIDGPANEIMPAVSPDGKWIAYASDETGREEVFLTSFPDLQGKWQVSEQGGTAPRWNPQGGELFFRKGNLLYAIEIKLDPGIQLGRPRELFSKPFDSFSQSSVYDVMPDGNGFVALIQGGRTPDDEDAKSGTEIYIVENWFDEITRLAPSKQSNNDGSD